MVRRVADALREGRTDVLHRVAVGPRRSVVLTADDDTERALAEALWAAADAW